MTDGHSGARRWVRAVFARRRASLAGLLLLAVGVIAVGCASSQAGSQAARIAPDELLAGAPLAAHGVPNGIASQDDVLAVTPEMKAFLDGRVERNGTPSLKLQQLVSAIIDSKTFGVEYDDRTRTASEIFRIRRGNCLSFSNLFVAMARHVGLSVQYQEVDVPPDWTLDQDTYVLNQHINIYVDLEAAGTRVVDFNIADFKASYELRTISDARARAHYYNNVGVERMQAGDIASSLACFRAALENDGTFSPAWTNLGTLYLRSGFRTHAEAAYQQALHVSSEDLVAMSDLSRLYQLTGEAKRAADYQKRVSYHRALNPYYRYELARRAYSEKKYDDAVGHLKYAIRKRPKEDQFYFLLGLTYLQKGDAGSARRWLARAAEVASTDALKRKYSNKIDILLRQTANHE